MFDIDVDVGADFEGSFFPDAIRSWNLSHLHNVLNLLTQHDIHIPGRIVH